MHQIDILMHTESMGSIGALPKSAPMLPRGYGVHQIDNLMHTKSMGNIKSAPMLPRGMVCIRLTI